MAGAPLGNQNGAKAKEWEQAIKRALARRGEGDYRKGLDRLADRLVDAAEGDDLSASIKVCEIVGDRIDGKPKQAVDVGVTPDEDNPLNKLVSASVELQSKIKGK